VEGDGYAVGDLDGLGEGYGFRKIRKELDVTEFGVNAIVLPPDVETGFHAHERRVDAPTMRKLKNVGDDDAVYVIVGAAGGYVGRDGIAPEGEQRVRENPSG